MVTSTRATSRNHSGITGLKDQPRSGRPRTLDHRKIVAGTLKPSPKKLVLTHWCSRLLAARLGIANSTVARARRDDGVQGLDTASAVRCTGSWLPTRPGGAMRAARSASGAGSHCSRSSRPSVRDPTVGDLLLHDAVLRPPTPLTDGPT